jgi:RNA polymerase sigma factor (sigma-70 family)
VFSSTSLGAQALAALAEALTERGIDVVAASAEAIPEPDGLRTDLDLVRVYLNDIGRVALLTPREEFHLAESSRDGDAEARKRLIIANLRLVVAIAARYQHRGLELLDLIEEGNIGLIRAVDRFRPEVGSRLATYAGWWVRQSIARALVNQGHTIRIPVHVVQLITRYFRARQGLERQLGRAPHTEEIALELGEDASRLEALSRLLNGVRSLDSIASRDALFMLAEEEGAGEPSPEELIELQLQYRRLDEFLRALGDEPGIGSSQSKRDEQVIRLRYGFADGRSRTLAEVGHELGISRERVRQIESRALARLRRLVEAAERAAEREEGELH